MDLRNVICAMCVVCLAASGSAIAGTNDMLIGLDSKITFGSDGQTNVAPASDAVLVVDISDPAKPSAGERRCARRGYF